MRSVHGKSSSTATVGTALERSFRLSGRDDSAAAALDELDELDEMLENGFYQEELNKLQREELDQLQAAAASSLRKKSPTPSPSFAPAGAADVAQMRRSRLAALLGERRRP